MGLPLSRSQDLATNPKAQGLDVVVPDWGAASLEEKQRENCVVGTWLGHASAMAQFPISALRKGEKNLWVLFDPIFSARAGPTQYTGPKRLKPPPCQVSDLPACDAVVISHNHYDHLDLVSIQAILKKFPECRYFVPLGNKIWFTSLGIPDELVHQLDWWQEREIFPYHFGFKNGKEEAMIRFTAVPAQHNSGRGALDQDTTLWSGWVIEQILHPKGGKRRNGAIYYAGDTGLRRTSSSNDICPAFEEIGKKLGPFDISFIPIWRGGTLSFISSFGLELDNDRMSTAFHGTPADAMRIHRLVGSRNTVPVHFGTFIGVENELFEATVAFNEAREKEEIVGFEEDGSYGRSGILDIGGSIVVEIEEKWLS